MPNEKHINQYSSDKTKTLVETAIYRVSKTHNFVQLAIEKVRFLPRDKEYLIKPETTVKHFDVMLDDRK
ncbi:hypothetical protein [Nostoc sphaeroides]|uniref:Antibiotic biosynthesis monooxygenase n=1 Tax=Nostoc sphaeroides CCNUC1 TaxID=2653204 RepID=A0A5P8W8W5_9NOSO|nr:hypothetical protein [Nostoc sphaeroides]MCC5627352.1 hypothetical protein [Nostoc sphaeroides CHAB 2801]QFS49195.1 antibiotic biosynthesis monooxygenase [Nostoc sphaeroides CCNUC1]